ncbi:hypothetical protein CLAFUW4_20021 [Fulvia fulva]|uniref:uncharacterized protein n=1 Tax=Passalora fulva TaxID=5499 RepID=UPI002852992C|nr:uncharacterized protein CLAFUR5_20021 [Fulvia fulva]KAK4628713.1 hypothetical protein CLAFUR4_20021 [Fulvia fulva]KAK4630166.1 hypothetical protein CLAFUR0_20021 [Fulvia fulva]WMI38812.1 hypothetical protein CLAFUR5_20021 [Fulvia fulva]WPV12184.1 hypothetical protein CLAFUW4_20021 [Fulvia fulva]WPV27885.1 hypothetical protein CLAFUW7_20021 [Fulvia fulva]
MQFARNLCTLCLYLVSCLDIALSLPRAHARSRNTQVSFPSCSNPSSRVLLQRLSYMDGCTGHSRQWSCIVHGNRDRVFRCGI